MSNSTPDRVFDRFLIGLTGVGLLVAVLAAIAMLRGPSAGAAAAEGGGEDVNGHIELSEFAIAGDLSLPAGNISLDVENVGGTNHNLVLANGPRTADIASGETTELTLGELGPGTYTLFCDIAGHRESGMETTLTVGEAGATAVAAEGHGDDPDWEALDQAMIDSILEFPAETEGIGNQPLEPTILADGTKEYRLTTAITPWEVEPGRVVDAWTYNGQVPGPAIRVDVGDKVRVIVDNQLPMGTDVHWHGIATPNDMDGVAPITQELIRSGEEFIYEFEATRPSIGMYHAHHHGQMQIPNGMFGTFIIGDTPLPLGKTIGGTTIPDDLEIAQEIPMVLNDAGVIGFSLNGKSFPATEPYVLQEGDWMVVHYYNEGLQIHPMHQHQFPQLVFAKDGFPLDYPYYADTVNVAPGERYSVLVQVTDPGVWVWHCHILNHVEREEGMFGMVTALIVEEQS